MKWGGISLLEKFTFEAATVKLQSALQPVENRLHPPGYSYENLQEASPLFLTAPLDVIIEPERDFLALPSVPKENIQEEEREKALLFLT